MKIRLEWSEDDENIKRQQFGNKLFAHVKKRRRGGDETFQMYAGAHMSVSSMKIMLYELFRKFVSSF